jgi:hypothetical protein
LYFSGSVEVFSDTMVVVLYCSGSMEVFSDIMVIFYVFFRVCGSVC